MNYLILPWTLAAVSQLCEWRRCFCCLRNMTTPQWHLQSPVSQFKQSLNSQNNVVWSELIFLQEKAEAPKLLIRQYNRSSTTQHSFLASLLQRLLIQKISIGVFDSVIWNENFVSCKQRYIVTHAIIWYNPTYSWSPQESEWINSENNLISHWSLLQGYQSGLFQALSVILVCHSCFIAL